MAKKQTPSIVTKIFVPVASAAIISLGGMLKQGWDEREIMKDTVKNLRHSLDSFIVITNDWVAHLDKEMAEQQKITKSQ